MADQVVVNPPKIPQQLPIVPKDTLDFRAELSGWNGIFDALDFMMFFVMRMTDKLTAWLFSPPLSYILGPIAALASIIHFWVDIKNLNTDKKINKKTGDVEFKKYNLFRTIRTGYTALAITAAITAGTVASILGVSAALGATIPLTFLALLTTNSLVNFTVALYYHFKTQKDMPNKSAKEAADYRDSRRFRSNLHIFIGSALGILALASGIGFLYGYSAMVIGMGVTGCSMLGGLSGYFLNGHYIEKSKRAGGGAPPPSTEGVKPTPSAKPKYNISLAAYMENFGNSVSPKKPTDAFVEKTMTLIAPPGSVSKLGTFSAVAQSTPSPEQPQDTGKLTMTVGVL